MGQAALKLDTIMRDAGASPVVHFKPAAGGARPTLVQAQPKSDLPSLLAVITRVATQLGSFKDRGDLWEKRCLAAEDQVKAANAKVSDLEMKLRAAVDEAKVERARANEIHKRSTEVVEKTRALLTDASERLRSAESRAERAENSFSSVRDAVERQLAPQLR